MEKWALVLVLVLVLSFQINYVSAEENASITGKATSSGASLTIVVIAAPSLELLRPVNGTYLIDENLELNYTALSADSVWYSLDNVENNTLTGNILFNTTEDEHTLRLYANNSNGLSSKTVTFNVNTTRLEIDYNGFRGSGSEGSTDFLKYSLEELEDFSGLTLKKGSYGQIYFNDKINVSDDEDSSDNFVNISKNVIISSNHLEINTTALPNFNKSATLYLYNLSFSNPRILMNGEICPPSICTKVSYSSGTLVFEVTHFTIYSAEETPSGETPSGGGGGGGGGSTINLIPSFEVSPDEIIVNMKQGETKERYVSIKNNYTKILSFSVGNTEKIKDFIRINEPSFVLGPGEVKNLTIDFLSKESSIPNSYIGKITIEADKIKKEILTVVNVNSKRNLFDVEVKIPSKYKEVISGDDVLAEIKIYNLGETGRVDAMLDYSIKDDEGNTLISASDTVSVETQAGLIKIFSVPEGAKSGRYVFYVGVTYDGGLAISTDTFEVIKVKVSYREKIYIVLILVSIIVIVFLIYLHLRKKEAKIGVMKRKLEIRDLMGVGR
ncbi:MAG: hypothetical protein KKB62_00200 [Nanoarchaeota archaeon]|nr:hypothetical protein [Nanoarchaeota archaeon]